MVLVYFCHPQFAQDMILISIPIFLLLTGILKFVEITVNVLVLICVGAAQASVAGFTSLGGFGTGSFSLNSAYSPFEGTELQEVRELDMQFTQMRAPCVYGGVAFSLTAAVLTLVFLVVGAKPIQQLRMGLLVGECAFNLLAGVAYVAAVGLYLHFVSQVNSTEVCKRRERLYARRGYTSMNCVVQGGDAAVGLFGVAAACLYFASFVVCILAIRTVRAFQSHAAKAQHSPKSGIRDRGVRSHHAVHRTSESSHNIQALATLVWSQLWDCASELGLQQGTDTGCRMLNRRPVYNILSYKVLKRIESPNVTILL